MTILDTWPPAVRAALQTHGGDALLRELDTLIRDLDAALADQNAARVVLADTELELALIEASVTLAVSGTNAEQRKAAITLTLRDEPGYQQLAATSREARAAIHDAERRFVVAKQRIARLRAALALLTEADGHRY